MQLLGQSHLPPQSTLVPERKHIYHSLTMSNMHKCLRRTKSTRQVNQSLVMTQLKSVPQAIPCISLFVPPELTCRLAWSKSTRRMRQKQSWQHQEGTRTSRAPYFLNIKLHVVKCCQMSRNITWEQSSNGVHGKRKDLNDPALFIQAS